ncbi:hypothetical protein ACNOYE_18395 [Nannocystaceae bacterium ST9]
MLGPRTLGLVALGLATLACVGPQQYMARGYESPKPASEPVATSGLISAHAASYGQVGGPDDVLVLVFASEIDPLGLVPEAFGIVRADGQRVRPVEVRLGPADEGDENRSVILVGEFGEPQAEPIAVHVIGSLFGEAGESFAGLDVEVSPSAAADRLLVIERLGPDPSRCPGAQQVLRTYWSDALAGVAASDLAAIELLLADGSARAPIDFDDHAGREGEVGLGPADDNVLDLCIDVATPVVRLRIAAGQFTDAQGHATAAAEVALSAG